MSVTILPVTSLPEIRPGDDLVGLFESCEPGLLPGDILIVTQKVVSKSENRLVTLEDVKPRAKAKQIAERWEKDPRLVELVLRESVELLREERGVLICRTRHGFVCANAGIDLSNVDGGFTACLLPEDCDRSARELSLALEESLGFRLPVIVSDSFGRPWRLGITNVALGSFGLSPLLDHRGRPDSCGLEMKATVIGIADTLAASTELVVGKTQGFGAAIVRGYEYQPDTNSGIFETIRPTEHCFFL
jgi:coenzyme F420-0:L-glutamate ligase / coenzyme F420-1:gamma-L-glutamate ligase